MLTLAFTPVTRLGRAPRLEFGRAGRLSPTRRSEGAEATAYVHLALASYRMGWDYTCFSMMFETQEVKHAAVRYGNSPS